MTVARSGGGGVQRSPQGGLAEVLDLVLDKGLVIDAFVKVSVVGIEILTIDARIVVASVDTYLRFAEATNRLDLHAKGGKGLPDLLNSGGRAAAEGATSAADVRRSCSSSAASFSESFIGFLLFLSSSGA